MFELGKVTVSEMAAHALQESGETPEEFLQRHARGDWGEVSDETRQANEVALRDGGRLESVYHTAHAVKLLVVTDADRAMTSILLPAEF